MTPAPMTTRCSGIFFKERAPEWGIWDDTKTNESYTSRRDEDFFIEGKEGKLDDFRTSGNHDVLGADGFFLAIEGLGNDGVLILESTPTLNVVDFVLFEQVFDTSSQSLDDFFLLLHHGTFGEWVMFIYTMALPKSIFAPPSITIPRSLKCLLASSYLWEIFNKALEGIHPTFKQVPPKAPLFSTQTVFKPSCPALIAAT